MYYFKFEIPTNADGTRVSYSPGWHGTMPHCPRDVVVELYNDKEGWGLAHTTDTFIPKEVEVIKPAEYLAILSSAKDEDDVFFADKLEHRWDEEVLDGR